MSDAFHWHTQLERGKTYASRAEECRVLARVCPEDLREGFLELANKQGCRIPDFVR